MLDYNGGKRTYDGHHGTDYALWPFSWNKVDTGEVQVVAAAAGTILSMANVDPTDHNCGGGSSDPWNYVALIHSNGQMTIYGHMRYNSLTSKNIGQAVTQGEVLGTVASSGNSSGPHLHFEVRSGSFSAAEWADPYAGPNSQALSLWADQRPYFNSAINRLATHSSPPSTPDPCQPTLTHLQDSFTTPVNIYFYAYYRDYQGALITQLKIYRPDGSIYQSWSYSDNTFFSGVYRSWAYPFTNSDPAGTWRFEAIYNDQMVERFFNVNAPLAITISSPNNGERWDRNQSHAVTWAANLGGDVNIALYRNGSYITPIRHNTPSNGAYLWTPGTALEPGTGYTIRVTSVINPNVYDTSDAPFNLTDGSLVAGDDFVMTLKNTPITIKRSRKRSKPHWRFPTITATGAPLNGTVSVVNARLIYTPALDFLGADEFTYTVSTNTDHVDAAVTVFVVPEVFHMTLPLILR